WLSPGAAPPTDPGVGRIRHVLPGSAREIVPQGLPVSQPDANFGAEPHAEPCRGVRRPPFETCGKGVHFRNGGPMLSPIQIDQYREEGFLRLPTLLEPEDIQELRSLLDPLFERFDDLPRANTRDLGARGEPPGSTVRSA